MATAATLNVALTAQTQQFTQAMTRAEKTASKFGKSLKAMAGVAAAALSARALLGGAKDLINAFSVQEQAVLGLKAALQTTGKSGSAALKLLTDRASELQKVTTHGDEAIIAASESFAQLATSLSASELAQAQEAMIGIADTFLRGDLSAAALLVGKSIGSTTNALSRYTIQVDANATQSEKLAQIMKQSAGFFEVSKAKTESLAGRMKQFKDAAGDLKEALGGVLVDILGLGEGTKGATDWINRMIEVVEANRNVILAWGKVLVEAGKTAWGVFRLIVNAAKNMAEIIGGVLGNIAALIVGVFTFDITLIKTALSEMKNAVVDNLTDISLEIDRLMGNVKGLMDASARTNVAGLLSSGRPGEAPAGETPAVGLAAPDVAGAGHGPKMPGLGIQIPSMKGFHPGLPGVSETSKQLERLENNAQRVSAALQISNTQTQTMADVVVGAFGQMAQAARTGSQSMLESFVNMIGDILKSIGKAKGNNLLSTIGQVLSFQSGGVVPGIGSRPVPALVHPGETVIPKGGAGQTVIVSQEINFNAAGFVGPEWWQENKGNIVQVIAEAAQEAPAFARALRG